MGDDRRRHRRIAFDLPLGFLTAAGPMSDLAKLVDLSAGGLMVILRAGCQVGSTMQLRFRWGGAFCVATGRVVRVMPMGHANAIAVEFEGADLAYLQFVAYLESLSAGHAQLVLAEVVDPEIVIW